MKTKKIVWINDVPWANSGMAIQSKNIIKHLVSLGHEVHYLAWYVGKPGEKTTYNIVNGISIDVYFLGEESFGNPMMVSELITQIDPDVIVSFGDMHMIEPLTRIEAEWQKKWAHWWTVDDKSPTPFMINTASKLPQLITTTKFGSKIIKKILNKTVPIIGHTYQSEAGKGDKIAAKEKLGIDKKSIVYGCIARNFWRKNLHTLLNSFAHVAKECPDAVLLLHTDNVEPTTEGCNVFELVKKLDISGKVHVSCNDLAQEDMVTVIDAMDFHVLACYGEGFGVPVIETMVRGIPNIVPNHTTLPELVGKTGYIVPLSISGNVHPQSGKEYFGPDPLTLANTIQETYKTILDNNKAYKIKSKKAISKTVQDYAPEKINNAWEEFIQDFNALPVIKNNEDVPAKLVYRFLPNKPKILICSMFYVPNLIGGGEYTIHEFAKGLKDMGWSVRVLTMFDGIMGDLGTPLPDKEILIDKIPVLQSGNHWYSHLTNILDTDKPDILMTYEINSWYSLRFLREANKRKVKTVMYEQYWRLLTSSFNNISKQTPNPPREGLECNKLTDLMLTNSDFTAKMFQKFLGRETKIIYPPMLFPVNETTKIGKYVVMINPSEAKGVKTAIYLASKFPDVAFKLVGAIGEDLTFLEMKKYPNITYQPHTENMSDVYENAKVVLFPSNLDESFGRVPIEAMSYGVPVIARNIGAVSSVLEDKAILIDKNAPLVKWENALKQLLTKPGKWKNQARAFALKKFNRQTIIDTLDTNLRELLKQKTINYKNTLSKPKIVAVCDNGFGGVKTALEYAEYHFKQQFVLCPVFSFLGQDMLIDVMQTIDQCDAKIVMYAGWSNVYLKIIKQLKLYRPHIKHIINWHSPLGQTELAGAGDIKAFIRCNQFLVSKEIDYIIVPFKKDADLFKQSYHPNYRWFPDTVIPISSNAKLELEKDYFKIGFFALPAARKNLLSQLSAIRLLHLAFQQNGTKWKGAKLYIGNGFAKHPVYIDFLDMLDIPYVILPYFENKQEYYDYLGAMNVNIQVTFSEAFNYVCAESLALKTPCLGSKMTPALTSNNPSLQEVMDKFLIVDNIDDTMEVFHKLYTLAMMNKKSYDNVCNACVTHIESLTVYHNNAIKELFDELYDIYDLEK